MESFEGFTAVYEPTEGRSYFARVLEVPGAFSQGRDMDEAREMLRDALLLMLETEREEAERELEGHEGVTRETLRV
jgi:predicted RNase H-like HicB family nuclease